MTTPQIQIVATGDLGKGLVLNPVTALIDSAISTDSNNSIVFGNDNGLYVDITGKFDNPTGNTSQYIAGDGSLITFPPVDIATMVVATVRNQSGSTILAGSPVYIIGASGNKSLVGLASNSSEITSSKTYGVTQTDIPNNQNGIAVIFGKVDGIDTTAYTEGTTLWLGMIPGTYTSVKPQAPYHAVHIGVVSRSHQTQGCIQVSIQNGFELEELHNVLINSPSQTDHLTYDSTQSVWINTPATSLQGDWEQNDSSSASYIKHKPDLGAMLDTKVDKEVGKQLSTENFTTPLKDKLTGLYNIAVSYGSAFPLASGNTGDIYFITDDGSSSGTIIQEFIYDGINWSWREMPQVQSDWDQADSLQKSFIKNKPNLGTVAVTNSYVDLLNKPIIPDAQIQSDWTQANTSLPDFIKNKPSIPSLVNADWNATSGFAKILNKPTIPDAQVNVDWNSTSGISQILNKPDMADYVLTSTIGQSTGIVPLNAMGKIDSTYINFTGATYKGVWNATTNVPVLADGTGTNADFYYVEVDGIRDMGNGNIQFYVGDLVIYDTATNRWRRVGGNGVTTVNGFTGVVTLDTGSISEATNLYFTQARVLATALANVSTSNASVLAATDSVLSGMGKLQAQITAINNAKFTVVNKDTTDSTYVYYGGTLGSGAWQINRWEMSTNIKTTATQINNSSVTSLTAAWTARITLNYI